MAGKKTMIEFSCEGCNAALGLPECFGGQRGRCPVCRATIGIPEVGHSHVAIRLCNSCGSAVAPEDLQFQGLEEVFCRGCLAEMARQSDSTILREVGLDLPRPDESGDAIGADPK